MSKIIKELLSVVCIIAVFLTMSVSANGITTEEHDEEIVWEILNKYTPNEKIAAAIMAAICQESGYKSNACHGYYLMQDGNKFCETQTKVIDEGLCDQSSRDAFCYHYNYCGYGLLQWCDIFELEKLYAYASGYGTSIGDAEMQCSFIIYDLQKSYEDLYTYMIDEDRVDLIAQKFTRFYVGTSFAERMFGRGDLAIDIYERLGTQN